MKDEPLGSQDEVSASSLLRLEVYGALLALFSLVLLLALATSDRLDVRAGAGDTTANFLGPVGAHMADLFLWVLGTVSFPFTMVLGIIGLRAVFRRPPLLVPRNVIWTAVAMVMMAILLQIGIPETRPFGYLPAGRLGMYAGEMLAALLSYGGAALVASTTLLIALSYLAGQSIGALLRAIGRMLLAVATAAWTGLRTATVSTMRAAYSRIRRRSVAEKEADAFREANTAPLQLASSNGLSDTRIDVRREFTFPSDQQDPQAGTRQTIGKNRPSNFSAKEPSEDVSAGPSPLVLDIAHSPPGQAGSSDAPRMEPTRSPRIVVTHQRQPQIQESLPLPRVASDPYNPPPLSLLDAVQARDAVIDRDLLRRNAETLERKLLDYKVEGKVVEIHPGPVVTMYEFLPAPGVKISQIANLSDDLTMALEAVSIRIVAPIPGKGVVGIEVPNALRETVYLREILASEAFARSRSKLTLALGKDIFGTPMVTDLAKMPHLLIAGATGSGKSVAVNAFILSLLYNASPEEVRMILVDPKVVELQVYEGIPHLLLPVVYDPKHAAAALRWAVEEMERRYELLARFGTRNLQSFNQRIDRLLGRGEYPLGADVGDTEIAPLAHVTDIDPDDEDLKKLPYIVIVLDEFADLMMVASKDVETAVARLAQKARAAGIHLVMATQRPSKEVITGLIKANFPSRIAFRVSSKIDSRIILDQSGADALLGFGDMLFLRPGSSVLSRIHGPFVADEEVGRVTAHLKAQGTPEYRMEILSSSNDSEAEEDPDDLDPLLSEAQDIVLESRRASISFLQRKLKIGYNRSARIMETLERRAIVGPPDSRGERQVLL
jgi:S-DNA-T family DNA segregation ATPase FtsK/SpoIIIE